MPRIDTIAEPRTPFEPPERPTAVYLFGSCLVDLFAPAAGLDAIALLAREGIRVIFPPGQTCCGQPAYSSGFPDEARRVASAQLLLFPEGHPIVVPSGSCAGMIRRHWADLFAGDPVRQGQARAIAARTYEFAEFLLQVVGFDRPDLGEPVRIALHTSCAARRELGTHLVGRALLARLAQVSLVDHDHEAECCGFGGTFALRHPEISGAMVTDKVAALRASGATRVVSADCGCLLNIGGCIAREDRAAGRTGVSLPVEHLASFLLRRTGGKTAGGR